MKKILGNKKAISTILAALLMVVIVVVASVMVYAWSTGLLGTLMGGNPNVGQETLTLDTATMASANVFTLAIRNSGKADASIATYYVKDSTGSNSYQKTGLTGPSILVNNVVNFNVDLNSGGTWTGTPFSFVSGYTYTVQIITARGTTFNFIVPR